MGKMKKITNRHILITIILILILIIIIPIISSSVSRGVSLTKKGMFAKYYNKIVSIPKDPCAGVGALIDCKKNQGTYSETHDNIFAKILGGQEQWTAELCKQKAFNLDSGPNQGTYVMGIQGTSYAHVEGERITIFSNNATLYLYKVTYSVSATECDIDFSIYLDSKKIAGPFELEKPVYNKRGELVSKDSSKSGAYINYSQSNYKNTCLVFDNSPLCIGGVNKICNYLEESVPEK